MLNITIMFIYFNIYLNYYVMFYYYCVIIIIMKVLMRRFPLFLLGPGRSLLSRHISPFVVIASLQALSYINWEVKQKPLLRKCQLSA